MRPETLILGALLGALTWLAIIGLMWMVMQ